MIFGSQKSIGFVFSVLVFSLFVCSVVFAAPNVGAPQMTSWVHQIGSWWLTFLIAGGGFIFAGIILGKFFGFRARKWCIIIGLFLILISMFGAEMVYLLPFLGSPVMNYKPCTVSTASVFDMTACVISGYHPANSADWKDWTSFFVFAIILPLAILFALFWNFTDFFENTAVRKVITFASALLAFRVLLASMFIDLLSYGFAGIGVLLVDYLFIGIIYSVMKKLWARGEMINEILTKTKDEQIADLTKQIREIRSTLAVLDPRTKKYKDFKAMLENLEKKLEKLEKQ